VQPELPGQLALIQFEPVAHAAFDEHGQVQVGRIAAEDLPGHLDIAGARHVNGDRRRFLFDLPR
jgi:hypothetical protein